MFGFLTQSTKDQADPLQSQKAASAWLRQLPALDVIGRQQHVMRAFDGMRASRREADLNRVAAIEYLDAALGADRRQLLKQYVENAEGAARLSERIWQATHELAQGFVFAYQWLLDAALAQPANLRWRPVLPLLFTRLVHYYGTDAKLRVFRFERWIPAKWRELHEIYVRAVEAGVDKQPCVLSNAGQGGTQWTVEQEYLFVLLVHQLNTGNLAPSELDWASVQLRAWARRLTLDSAPRAPEGFLVDLAGRAGLARRTGSDAGSLLRYLDTTPLAEQLERTVQALRQAETADGANLAVVNQQRIAILDKVRPAVAPNLQTELRRDPRVPVSLPARVRVGLSRICRDLASREAPGEVEGGGTEQIEVYAVSDGPRVRRPNNEQDTIAASISMFGDPQWQVKDRSVAGLRIAASGGIGQSLTLGALVAVRQSDVSDWVLGVVRRLNKLSNDEVEAGVSIIAERVVALALAARRGPREDTGIVVDGFDISTIGARFDGLYLPPPSVLGGAQADPHHRSIGLHGGAAAPGRAARRVELGSDPDRRQARARGLTGPRLRPGADPAFSPAGGT